MNNKHLAGANAPNGPKEKKDMKVFLVRPSIMVHRRALDFGAAPSLGLAYLAGYIQKHGYTSTIIDSAAEGLGHIQNWELSEEFNRHGITPAETIAKIPEDVDVIGVNAMMTSEWPMTRELIQRLRAAFPNALLVAGGEHITALSEFSLEQCPELDALALGEGEETFYELLEAHRKGKDFSSIPGLAFQNDDGEYVSTGRRARIRDIDEIPWPLWTIDYLKKFWDSGRSNGVSSKRDVPFLVSRGCPYQCTFCTNTQMWTNRYILRSVDDAIAEIQYYIDEFKITGVQLFDLTAVIKKKWILEFCQQLKDKNIKIRWSLPTGTRSEALDVETLTMLRDTGCKYIGYAPESGSERSLKAIKKKIDLVSLTRSVMQAKDLGFVTRCNLIIGFPHETRKDIYQTLRYAFKVAAKGVDEVWVSIIMPLPGTELFNDLRKRGEIEVNDEFLFHLARLNHAFSLSNMLTHNPHVSSFELCVYKFFTIYACYLIGYILYPSRIVRTVRNLMSGTNADSFFEHRLLNILHRKKATTSAPGNY